MEEAADELPIPNGSSSSTVVREPDAGRVGEADADPVGLPVGVEGGPEVEDFAGGGTTGFAPGRFLGGPA